MPIDKPFACLAGLLRLALGGELGTPGLMAPDEWREVYRLAQRHAVIGMAWDGVERLQAEASELLRSMPSDLMGKWFADVQTIAAANSRMAKQTVQVQALLQAGGFDSQVLKGASLAAYYPNPAHRQAADIDLWVLPKQTGMPASLSTHRKALIACLQQQYDIRIDGIVYHHIETTIDGTDVELHVTPTWLCHPVHNSRLQQLFAQHRQLTPELQELYALLHAFRHIYHDGLALRHVTDYYLVCHYNRKAGIQTPEQLYKQLGLTSFARTMNELSAYLFDNQNADRLSRSALHLSAVLPQRRVSRKVQWDYPGETLFNLPWRAIHLLWRRWKKY
ncbi:MAG: nucleotidyltransferase family protein [Paludibacteraceae bacterium]|nr:nucleotidyltransferase family protein [Paludibacteraceae bacterium]